MRKILVTGACGQVGHELVPALRTRYGSSSVIAAGHKTAPDHVLLDAGPFRFVDCTNLESIGRVVKESNVGVIYHLSAMLSAVAETNPHQAWSVNVDGLRNILEIAREFGCAVFVPSSIAVFGPGTPLDMTPQDTIQRPKTIYGAAKVTGELLCDYYYHRFGVDTRGVRWPGLISYVAPPGGGTTDYAVEMLYAAANERRYTACFIGKDTHLDMMYMPDAIRAAIEIMEAEPSRLRHRNAYNIASMSFAPEQLAEEIRKHVPEFVVHYNVDPLRQRIADSWPNQMDDTAAREEWGWNPKYDLPAMTRDMLKNLSTKPSTMS